MLPRLPTLTPEELFRLPAGEWNKLIDFLRTNAVLSALGKTRRPGDSHPWATTCEWDADLEGFLLTVEPGFVNSLECETENGGQETAESESSPVSRPPSPGLLTSYFFPVAPSRFVADAPPPDALLERFDPDTHRFLAVSLWIQKTRPSVVTAQDELGRTYLTLSGAEGPARLFVHSSAYTAPVGTGPVARLVGEGTDTDVCPIATIWLVSPETRNAELGTRTSELPNGDWSPWVEQHTFWNLEYGWEQPILPSAPSEYPGIYVGAVGSPIIQSMLLEKNLKESLAVSSDSPTISGYFWSL